MRESDYHPFAELLDATCSLLSRGAYQPSATNTALWFRALASHELDVVRAGFDAHIRDPQRGRFVPTPADVIEQINRAQPQLTHPEADEAWSTALRASDERETVVWTEQMTEALRIAQPILDGGDRTGARFAFRAAYERLVDEARALGRPATWSPSIGWDAEKREKALQEAVERDLLPSTVLQALPAPARDPAPLLRLVARDQADSPAAIEAKAKLRGIADGLRSAGTATRRMRA